MKTAVIAVSANKKILDISGDKVHIYTYDKSKLDFNNRRGIPSLV
jgi:hypothetical protein